MTDIRKAAYLPPASTRQRIGIFGGSFDPPHAGHLHVAETALKQLDLDQVWWFPARGNPLKNAPSDFDRRLDAVHALASSNRAMRVSDIEERVRITYTVDLVRLLRAHCAEAQLVWLMGSDSLQYFHKWKDWRTIAGMIPIAVVARPGSTMAARNSIFAQIFQLNRVPRRSLKALPNAAPPAWGFLTAPLNPASSTALRGSRRPKRSNS
ncbi:MAG: nicotinate (nicotinamide) nucleotide adenylyltransferase [Pseudomonadota bacterium]